MSKSRWQLIPCQSNSSLLKFWELIGMTLTWTELWNDSVTSILLLHISLRASLVTVFQISSGQTISLERSALAWPAYQHRKWIKYTETTTLSRRPEKLMIITRRSWWLALVQQYWRNWIFQSIRSCYPYIHAATSVIKPILQPLFFRKKMMIQSMEWSKVCQEPSPPSDCVTLRWEPMGTQSVTEGSCLVGCLFVCL